MSDSESDSDTRIRPFFPRFLFPDEEYALDGIAIRAQLLGLALGLSFSAAVTLYLHNSLYHLPTFFCILSVFHFLEFYITARYNTRRASISSFLFTNGRAYTAAHTIATLECFLSHFLPLPSYISAPPPAIYLTGLCMVIFGQTIRSLAMIHAAASFNHHVASRKEVDHKLVTSGVYRYFRHPSYFGFWVWGLGTQVMMGNVVCFWGYAVVLWKFFSGRIKGEEEYLIRFFGKKYVDYRARTRVWIPFIP
ncbi:hypothetical protein TWF694_000534 [Orbilia ellipsospora]|uniref:Protein-S-isoprenylcysteine O-methyltransferase n=1 Tax=Orbilia ellipsospora TaxID=2528407 RepID=A0AAV9XNZ3_9PEZI